MNQAQKQRFRAALQAGAAKKHRKKQDFRAALQAGAAKKSRKEQELRVAIQAGSQRKAARRAARLDQNVMMHHQAATPAEKLKTSLSIIRKKIIKGAASGQARPLAMQVLKQAGVPPRDERGEIRALATFMQKAAPYRSDIWGVETIADLGDVIQQGGADCDCYTVALGQLGMSAGYPVRLKVVGNERLSHIYPEFKARRAGVWIPADATKPGDPTAINRTWRHELTIPIDPWIRDEEFSSWLSEVGKKVFGKKAGKKLEKRVNKGFSRVVETSKMVASILPGGQQLSEGLTKIETLKHYGEDPTKMSKKTIKRLAVQNPALAKQIKQLKASKAKGWKVSGSGGLRYDPAPGLVQPVNVGPDGTAYTDEGALVGPAIAAAVQGGGKTVTPGAFPLPLAAAQPANGSSTGSMLPLLLVGGLGAYLLLKK